MYGLVPVMIGGGLGAGARYLVGLAVAARDAPGFPWATLTVNLIGGLLMGVLAGLVARGSVGEPQRLLLGVGVLGGFTTFSAFGLDALVLIERGNPELAFGYIAASVVGSIALVALGMAVARA